MRLWEVMRLLEENPTNVYEAKLSEVGTVRITVKKGFSRYYKFEVFNGKKLIDQSLGGGAFNGNGALDLDWQFVKQPVTWQEAIQAGADNKRVWCEFNNQSWSVPELVVHHLYLKKALEIGKWYVED